MERGREKGKVLEQWRRRERPKLSDRAKNVELWSQAIRCDTCAILAFNSSTPHSRSSSSSRSISHMSWEHIRTHYTCEQITFCSSVSLNRIDVTASTTKINDIVNLTWMAFLLWSTCECVCISRTSHILYQPNRDMVWYILGRHWCRRRCCCCCCRRLCVQWKFEIVAKTNYQTQSNVHAQCMLTHSNDTLKFTAQNGTALWKHRRRDRESKSRHEWRKGMPGVTVVFSNFADTNSVNICNSSRCEHARRTKTGKQNANQLKYSSRFFDTRNKRMRIYSLSLYLRSHRQYSRSTNERILLCIYALRFSRQTHKSSKQITSFVFLEESEHEFWIVCHVQSAFMPVQACISPKSLHHKNIACNENNYNAWQHDDSASSIAVRVLVSRGGFKL